MKEIRYKTGLVSVSFRQHSPKEILEAATIDGATEYRIFATMIIPLSKPVLATVASAAEGETLIYGASRLRIKESDRLQTTYDTLFALGADIKLTDDGFVIRGKQKLLGGTVSSHNDHRIAMSAAVAACICENSVTVENAEAVSKSYPDFWQDFKKLGFNINTD